MPLASGGASDEPRRRSSSAIATTAATAPAMARMIHRTDDEPEPPGSHRAVSVALPSSTKSASVVTTHVAVAPSVEVALWLLREPGAVAENRTWNSSSRSNPGIGGRSPASPASSSTPSSRSSKDVLPPSWVIVSSESSPISFNSSIGTSLTVQPTPTRLPSSISRTFTS